MRQGELQRAEGGSLAALPEEAGVIAHGRRRVLDEVPDALLFRGVLRPLCLALRVDLLVLLVPVTKETYGFFAMCFALKESRPVAIQPVLPSQTGCRMRARGRPLLSTVVTVHQTIRRTRASNSAAMSSNELTSGMAALPGMFVGAHYASSPRPGASCLSPGARRGT
jgi:hypothetical protein